MNLMLFIIVVAASFIIVRIGAIAFELTGLEWTLAKFQALSCFSGTGFTTQESELVVTHPQRRKIASILMILGNAGLVTMIATFANTLRPNLPQFEIPFLHLIIPSMLLPWINLVIIIWCVYFLYRIFTHSKMARIITEALRSRLVKSDILQKVTIEELMISTGGYGVASIEVCPGSEILNKTLLEADLRKEDVNILAIERQQRMVVNPKSGTRIRQGDRLICFGKLENIRSKICSVKETKEE